MHTRSRRWFPLVVEVYCQGELVTSKKRVFNYTNLADALELR